MSWLYYLAEANIYLGVFYLAYCLFLNRDTHYQLNRVYLIFSCVISFILPVLQIGALKSVRYVPVSTVIDNNTVAIRSVHIGTPITAVAASATPVVVSHHFTFQDGLWYTYLFGAVILLLTLLIKLYTLYRLMHNEQCIRQGKHKVVYLAGTDVAFSFFNYLFIGTNAVGANTIIRHELVHIRQKHSADIIFLELLKIINWFNPCIYLLQKSLKTVHEYIADEQTAAYETDALTYSSFLVNNAYGAGGSSITHSFFNYNLLKKRIIMLNQQRSGNLARLKYLVAVPICAGLLCASTLAFSKTYGWDILPAKNLSKTPFYKPANTSERVYLLSKFHSHLMFNIKYPDDASRNNVTGSVIATFTLADNKLKNIKIIRSIGHGTDEEVIKALKSYPQPINMPSGNYAVPFFFTLGINSPDVHHPDENGFNKDYKGVADGYTFLPNDVIIVGYPNTAKSSQISNPGIIKLAPRYTAPVKIAKSQQPNTTDAAVATDTISKYAMGLFGKYLARNIHYSRDASDNNITGRVIASFSVTDNKIDNVTIVRGLAHGLDEEVQRVLKQYNPPANMPPGKYFIPVAFVIGGNIPSQDVSSPDNKGNKVNAYQIKRDGINYLDEVVIVTYKN